MYSISCHQTVKTRLPDELHQLWSYMSIISPSTREREIPLWIVCPPYSFASISCTSLKLVWKSVHLAQALLIGISHPLPSLRMWQFCFYTHYTVQNTVTLWLTPVQGAQANVVHSFHRFMCLMVHNIATLNVGSLPLFKPNERFTAHGLFFVRLW